MPARLPGLFCLLGVLVPAAAGAQCASRYAQSFAIVPSIGLRGLSQAQASAEVYAIFGARPDACEAGAYQRFVDLFRDYAREAMRAPKSQREGMLRVAIAAAAQGPQRVPSEEARTDVTYFRQARSDLHAIADDVGLEQTPLLQQLLDAFDRSGPPASLPPPPPLAPLPGGPGANGQVQTIRVPSTPLQPWAIVALYEVRDALDKKNLGVAQGKIEAILRWLESAP